MICWELSWRSPALNQCECRLQPSLCRRVVLPHSKAQYAPLPPRRGALLLVSRRWQRVLVEESAAFACFVLRPCPERLGGQAATPAQQGAWLEGQRSFLHQVAPQVHELVVREGSIIQRQANKAAKPCQLPRQLSLLRPGSLAGLVLDYVGSCSEPLLAALARAGGGSLTRLEINSTRLPASAPRVLRALSTLRSLDLGCYFPKDELFQAILTLTSLTRLALHPIGSFYDQASCLLTTLSALRQLSISEFARPPPYPEPQVRQLLQRASRLEALSYARKHMTRDRVGFEVCGGSDGCVGRGGAPCLTSLVLPGASPWRPTSCGRRG